MAQGRMTGEVVCHISQASKVFSELCNSVFLAHVLSLETNNWSISLCYLVFFCMVQRNGLPHKLLLDFSSSLC